MGDRLAPGTHTVTVCGVDQRFHIAGRGPICVAHPGGPGVSWDYLRMPQLEEYLQLVYIEPIGTGASGRLADPRGYSCATYVRCLDAVLSRLGTDPVFLLGHGYGGFVAQRYGLDHSSRVAGLILYATSPVVDDQLRQSVVTKMSAFPTRHPGRRAEAAQVVQAFQEASAATDDEAFVRGMRGAWPAYVADYWAREATFAPLRARLQGWAAPQRAAESEPFDVRAELSTIEAPTLVLAGAHDPLFGPRWAALLQEHIPHSSLLVLHDSGNLPHLEQPTAFTGAVADFVFLVAAE